MSKGQLTDTLSNYLKRRYEQENVGSLGDLEKRGGVRHPWLGLYDDAGKR
jgi:hypothetical protein